MRIYAGKICQRIGRRRERNVKIASQVLRGLPVLPLKLNLAQCNYGG